MRVLPLTTSGLVLLLLCGCVGSEHDEPAARSAQGLYFESGQHWSVRDVTVCWATPGFSTEKAWIRESLAGQYSWIDAGNINFVGWQDCTGAETDSFEISLSNVPNVPSYTVTNFNLALTMSLQINNPQSVTPRCLSAGLDRRDCIGAVALHEFGHAIGWLHEHDRHDTPAECEPNPEMDGDSTWGSWDDESIMNYCATGPHLSGTDRLGTARVYGQPNRDTPRLTDFNFDGRDDLFCYEIAANRTLDYSAGGADPYGSVDFSGAATFCIDPGDRIYPGDFNGDGYGDVLCHNIHSGHKSILRGTSSGFGTVWTSLAGWCNYQSDTLHIADFNGDSRDDILCHRRSNGRIWIDYASDAGEFHGTDDRTSHAWCHNDLQALYTGDFDDDGRDDLLCHQVDNGRLWIDYYDPTHDFQGTDWTATWGWCSDQEEQMHIVELPSAAGDSLLCHHTGTGALALSTRSVFGGFTSPLWSSTSGPCQGAGTRVYTGDVDGDGGDDVVCHRLDTGLIAVDYYQNLPGQPRYGGTDWQSSSPFCADWGNRLH